MTIQLIIGIVLFSSFANAEDLNLENISYGDLQLVYEKSLNRGRTDLSLQYVGGFGNPQYDLQGGVIRGDRWISNDFSLGLSAGRLVSSPSALQTALDRTLAPVQIQYLTPQDTYYSHLGYSPFHHLMNFFGNHFISADLIFSMSPGITRYSNGAYYPGIQFSVDEKILAYKNVGISFGLSQIWERSGDGLWTNRGQWTGGLYVQL